MGARRLGALHDVLRGAARVRAVADRPWCDAALEGTGIYSMPVCHALLADGEFEQVLVCNAGM